MLIVAFSLGFLLPFLGRAMLGIEGLTPLLAGSGLGILLLARRRSTRALAGPALAGLLLFAARAPDMGSKPPPFPPAPRGVLVSVTGCVGEPGYVSHGRCVIRLAGGPRLVHPGDLDGPLPGTRLRARGRLEAHGREIVLFDRAALEVLQEPAPWHLPAHFERMRRWLRRRMERGLSEPAAAHLKTLVLGDRSLPREERERLARTGTLHLFAVSGMHLVMLLGILRRSFGAMPRLLVVVLLVYAAVTGFASPVGRAFLTTAGTLFARALGRRPAPGPHFLLAMVLVLAWNPGSLEDPGFLLSFGAAAGILFLAVPVLERERRDPLRHLLRRSLPGRLRCELRSMILVSLAAFAASLPTTAVLFHRVAFSAIAGSIVLAPVIHLMLIAGLTLAVLPGLLPLCALVEGCVISLDAMVKLLDRLPLGSVNVAEPSPWSCALVAVALAVLAHEVRAGGRPRRRTLAAVVLSLAALGVPIASPPGVRLLDAGRGMALLVSTPEGDQLLDCGPATARVADQLLDAGIDRIATVLLSHQHEDHAGGFPEIAERLGARRCLASDVVTGAFVREAVHRGSPSPEPMAVLWPPRERPRSVTANDRSLVVHLELPWTAVLSLGDLETRGLRDFLHAGPVPAAGVVIAPHHGARNDALADLLLETTPDEVWIPARAGFPDEGTLLLLAWAGIPVRMTVHDRRIELPWMP